MPTNLTIAAEVLEAGNLVQAANLPYPCLLDRLVGSSRCSPQRMQSSGCYASDLLSPSTSLIGTTPSTIRWTAEDSGRANCVASFQARRHPVESGSRSDTPDTAPRLLVACCPIEPRCTGYRTCADTADIEHRCRTAHRRDISRRPCAVLLYWPSSARKQDRSILSNVLVSFFT